METVIMNKWYQLKKSFDTFLINTEFRLNKFTLIILVIPLLSLYGCPDKVDVPDFNFYIVNNGNETIKFYFKFSNKELTCKDFNSPPSVQILPNSKFKEGAANEFFENNNKLWVFVFKESTLEKHTWQDIQDNNIFDKRFSLSLEEMKALNYEVIYDGT